MSTPDPVPTPAPQPAPGNMPWYRSPIIVSALAMIIVRIANHVKTTYDVDLTIFGIDANEAAEYVIDGLVALASFIIVRARATQKHAPTIVFKQPVKGDDVKKASMFLIAAAAAALMTATSGLSGCALLSSATNTNAILVQQGIEIATSVYISHKGGGTAAGDLAAAQSVKAVAQQLLGVNTGTLTVAQFNQQMQSYIAKLSVTQQIIATGVLQQIDLYLAQQSASSGSILNASATAAADVVLNDIIAACALYGA